MFYDFLSNKLRTKCILGSGDKLVWSEKATSGVTVVLAESILEVIPITIRHIYDEKKCLLRF